MSCADPKVEGLDAVMSCEIGGANGLEPLAIAARIELPVVDADFMGRAFPELQVCMFLSWKFTKLLRQVLAYAPVPDLDAWVQDLLWNMHGG